MKDLLLATDELQWWHVYNVCVSVSSMKSQAAPLLVYVTTLALHVLAF